MGHQARQSDLQLGSCLNAARKKAKASALRSPELNAVLKQGAAEWFLRHRGQWRCCLSLSGNVNSEFHLCISDVNWWCGILYNWFRVCIYWLLIGLKNAWQCWSSCCLTTSLLLFKDGLRIQRVLICLTCLHYTLLKSFFFVSALGQCRLKWGDTPLKLWMEKPSAYW